MANFFHTEIFHFYWFHFFEFYLFPLFRDFLHIPSNSDRHLILLLHPLSDWKYCFFRNDNSCGFKNINWNMKCFDHFKFRDSLLLITLLKKLLKLFLFFKLNYIKKFLLNYYYQILPYPQNLPNSYKPNYHFLHFLLLPVYSPINFHHWKRSHQTIYKDPLFEQ